MPRELSDEQQLTQAIRDLVIFQQSTLDRLARLETKVNIMGYIGSAALGALVTIALALVTGIHV